MKHGKRRFGLRSKFLLLTGGIFILVFGGITLLLLRRNTTTLRTSLQEKSTAFAILATKPIGETYLTFKDSGTLKISEQMQSFVSLDNSIINIRLVDIQGDEVFILYDTPERSKIDTEEASSFTETSTYNEGGLLTRLTFPFFENSGARRYSVVYDISPELVEKEIRQQIILFISFGLLSLLLTSAVTYLLIYDSILKPIRSLSMQAVAISDGKLDQTISVKRQDEIGELGEAVERMSQSLQKSIANLKEVDVMKTEFMNIVSHNLRTPLTIINGYTDSADMLTKPEQIQSAFDEIGKASQRLGRFSEDLLAVASLELDKDVGEKRPLDITKLVTEVVDQTKAQAESKALHFIFNTVEVPGSIIAYEPHVRAALYNLIDNAIKFTQENGEVSLSLSYDPRRSSVRIDVKDNGIGISQTEQANLFTKFHRGTPTMVYNYEGVGIGLYASKMMIEHQNGSLTFASKEGVGSIFSITLPLQSRELIAKSKVIPWGQYRPPTPPSQPL